MQTRVRPAAVAGTFYPAEPDLLRGQVEVFMEAAESLSDAERAAPILIVPHAGYVYSGAIAARAYAQLVPRAHRIRRVVIFGPTHRVAARGIVAPASTIFETPLGLVPVDTHALERATDVPGVSINEPAHAEEHAIEVQLPFLQVVLDEFAIVPFAVGMASGEAVAQVIDALRDDDGTVFVISSDLSHYLPYDSARQVDRATVHRILALQSDIDYDEACGATAINGAVRVAREHGLRPRLLAMCNSGDTLGDRARVVGYCAMAFEESAGGHA